MSCCDWKLSDKDTSGIMLKYHDEEWGVPIHDDRKQFEFLMMEALQCGLSWYTVLKKREILRMCFDNFDSDKIAIYGDADIERIMNTPGMIRSERKVRAVIENAKHFQRIREQYGTFSDYLWRYSDGKAILYEGHEKGYVPASNGLSKIIADDLRKRGFKYLGEVTVYAHLQACGIINDHGSDCECYQRIIQQYPSVKKEQFLEKDVKFFP